MERMHHYWCFISIHSSKYGKDASLLGLHVHTSSKYGNDASLLGLHVHNSSPYTPVSLERMHHYRGFMSIHSSKYGKDASLQRLHVHTLQ